MVQRGIITPRLTRRVSFDSGLQHWWYLQRLRNREVWWSSHSHDDQHALKSRNLGHEVEVGTRSRHKRRGGGRRKVDNASLSVGENDGESDDG